MGNSSPSKFPTFQHLQRHFYGVHGSLFFLGTQNPQTPPKSPTHLSFFPEKLPGAMQSHRPRRRITGKLDFSGNSTLTWIFFFFFFPIALADVALDEFLRRPRQRMCPGGSEFGQIERWEWIWILLKRSRCTVSFPLFFMVLKCTSVNFI